MKQDKLSQLVSITTQVQSTVDFTKKFTDNDVSVVRLDIQRNIMGSYCGYLEIWVHQWQESKFFRVFPEKVLEIPEDELEFYKEHYGTFDN